MRVLVAVAAGPPRFQSAQDEVRWGRNLLLFTIYHLNIDSRSLWFYVSTWSRHCFEETSPEFWEKLQRLFDKVRERDADLATNLTKAFREALDNHLKKQAKRRSDERWKDLFVQHQLYFSPHRWEQVSVETLNKCNTVYDIPTEEIARHLCHLFYVLYSQMEHKDVMTYHRKRSAIELQVSKRGIRQTLSIEWLIYQSYWQSKDCTVHRMMKFSGQLTTWCQRSVVESENDKRIRGKSRDDVANFFLEIAQVCRSWLDHVYTTLILSSVNSTVPPWKTSKPQTLFWKASNWSRRRAQPLGMYVIRWPLIVDVDGWMTKMPSRCYH